MTSPTGTGHDAARCSACGLLGGDHTLWCAAVPAEQPVAAPDHAGTIRFALGLLPDLEETEFHLATAALDALVRERQQDKERIEELREVEKAARRLVTTEAANIEAIESLVAGTGDEQHQRGTRQLAKEAFGVLCAALAQVAASDAALAGEEDTAGATVKALHTEILFDYLEGRRK